MRNWCRKQVCASRFAEFSWQFSMWRVSLRTHEPEAQHRYLGVSRKPVPTCSGDRQRSLISRVRSATNHIPGELFTLDLQSAARIVVCFGGGPLINITHHIHYAPARLIAGR